jgi:hypothetical protein
MMLDSLGVTRYTRTTRLALKSWALFGLFSTCWISASMDALYGVQRLLSLPCRTASKPYRCVQQSCLALVRLQPRQTMLENEESIGDVVMIVQRTAAILAPSASTFPTSVSAELKSRVFNQIAFVEPRFFKSVKLTSASELESICATTAKWSKEEKNLPRRLLDARRVAKELEGVMDKIRQANELFLVRLLQPLR